MVAAIQEIVRTTCKSVLICAQSNQASDEIALRLIKKLRSEEVIRIYAKTHEKKNVDESIATISNLRNAGFSFPSLNYLYRFRVVVCTISTAGNIARGRDDPDFDPTHFSHIFIDEAASIPETATFVPIFGISTDKKVLHARIILAGDPKQLDAVSKSYYATLLGYKTSFMEYLFHQESYKRHETFGYDPKRIVLLNKSYRCHPAIMKVPNILFYNGNLQSMANTGRVFCDKIIKFMSDPGDTKSISLKSGTMRNFSFTFRQKYPHYIGFKLNIYIIVLKLAYYVYYIKNIREN